MSTTSTTPAADAIEAAPRKKMNELLDHEYDGIREFDNPTPGWWHMILVLSVLFSAFYVMYWHLSPMSPTIHDDWNKAQAAEYKRIFGAIGDLKGDEPTILKMMANAQMMEVARGVFESNCAACHGKDGRGINGVNLTDNHYKNVKKLGDVFKVINVGANNGAMPSWQNRLSENERVIAAAYVARMRGTNVAGGKGPEGEEIPAWPPLPAADAAAPTAPAGTPAPAPASK